MNIYIGNMSFDTTEDHLRQAFEGYGEVTSIKIISDRETGQAKGFAFVEMSGQENGAAAINGLNGQELNGRALNVDEAKPRTEGGNRNGANRSRNAY